MKSPCVLEVQEWSTREFPLQLTERDRQLLRQFKTGPNGDLVIEEMRDSIRIKACSSIGVVRLDSLEIRIYPKLAQENLRVVQMLGMTRGIDLLRRFKQSPSIAAQDHSLFDLLVLLLVEETEQLIRHGLLASYRDEEDVLPMMRGRLLADQQVLKRFGVLDRLHCRFDELSSDIIKNQLLARALIMCSPLISNPFLRHRTRSCLGDLLLSCQNLDEKMDVRANSITYDRLNQHYRPAHELCWLLLAKTGVRDLYAAGSIPCFSFLIDMASLFEQFVEQLLRYLLQPKGYRVNAQKHDATIIRDANTGKPYATVIPDLRLLSPSGPEYCVDAKYKLYDEKKISSDDIYQLFLYAFAFAKDNSERRSVLIFPSEQTEEPMHQLKIHCADGSIGWVTGIGIHIPTVLDELDSIRTSSTLDVILEAFNDATVR